MVEEPERERRAGHTGARDCEQGRDDTGDVHELAGEPAPGVEGGDTVSQLRARRVELADERDLQFARQTHGALDGRAAVDADCSVMLSARDPKRDNAAPVDLRDLGRRGGVGPRV